MVDASGVAAGGAAASVASVSSDATAALAASSTATTVSTAADTMANVVVALQQITVSVSNLAGTSLNSTGGGGTIATGATSLLGSSSASGALNATGGGGTNVTGGAVAGNTLASSGGGNLSGSYDGLMYQNGVLYTGPLNGISYVNGVAQSQASSPPAPSLPVASVPNSAPSAGGGASASALTVNIDMRGAMVGNQSQMLQAVTAAVQKGLTGNLFAAGARLTQ